MTASVEQLTQKIASLDRQTQDLKAKLDLTYGGYLQVLVRVFQQQTLQACYHICTEGYPVEFVALSMTQRHDLQQRLKRLTQVAAEFIAGMLENPPPPPPPVQMPGFFAMTPEQFLSIDRMDDGDDDEGDEGDQDDEDSPSFTLDLTDPRVLADFSTGIADSQRSTIEEILGEVEIDQIEEVDLEDMDDDETDDDDMDDETDDDDDDSPMPQTGRRRMTEADARELQAILSQVAAAITAKEPKTPVDRVLSWQDSIEHGIREQICLASYQINQAFQSAKLIPPQVPDRALEAASRADGDGATKISHVIQMLVELGNVTDSSRRDSTDREDDTTDRDSSEANSNQPNLRKKQARDIPQVPRLTHVIALQVRLSEIEFQDPLLMRWRRSLRELKLELNSLNRDYRKYQRQLSIAEAQVAWRSTWLSDR